VELLSMEAVAMFRICPIEFSTDISLVSRNILTWR
jgi:hypothetical protein